MHPAAFTRRSNLEKAGGMLAGSGIIMGRETMSLYGECQDVVSCLFVEPLLQLLRKANLGLRIVVLYSQLMFSPLNLPFLPNNHVNKNRLESTFQLVLISFGSLWGKLSLQQDPGF